METVVEKPPSPYPVPPMPPIPSAERSGPTRQTGKTGTRLLEVSPINIAMPDWLPRKFSNLEDLETLTESVRQAGVTVPLLVRPLPPVGDEDAYELVAGQQRLKAAKKAGLAVVPVLCRTMSDAEALKHALMQNTLQKELGQLEETESIVELVRVATDLKTETEAKNLIRKVGKQPLDFGNNVIPQNWETTFMIFVSLGLNIQSFRSNRLPMLDWPKGVKTAVLNGKIKPGVAREIVRIESPEDQKKALKLAIDEEMTVKQVKGLKRDFNGENHDTICGDALRLEAKQTIERLEQSPVYRCPQRKAELAKLLRQINNLTENKDVA